MIHFEYDLKMSHSFRKCTYRQFVFSTISAIRTHQKNLSVYFMRVVLLVVFIEEKKVAL